MIIVNKKCYCSITAKITLFYFYSSGKIIWRHLSTKEEKLLDLQLENKIAKTLSYDPTENATFVRTWNVVNGALHNEERFETVITDNTVKNNELGMYGFS